jgi:hypothetical protein
MLPKRGHAYVTLEAVSSHSHERMVSGANRFVAPARAADLGGADVERNDRGPAGWRLCCFGGVYVVVVCCLPVRVAGIAFARQGIAPCRKTASDRTPPRQKHGLLKWSYVGRRCIPVTEDRYV